MKVLILCGTGVFGKSAAALLARDEQITDIMLTSRHLGSAQLAADEIGGKARAVSVDIKDQTRFSSIASNFDLIVNAAGPTSKVQVPALQAAIEAVSTTVTWVMVELLSKKRSSWMSWRKPGT